MGGDEVRMLDERLGRIEDKIDAGFTRLGDRVAGVESRTAVLEDRIGVRREWSPAAKAGAVVGGGGIGLAGIWTLVEKLVGLISK